jgi:oligosaccharide repeat unit polymerase
MLLFSASILLENKLSLFFIRTYLVWWAVLFLVSLLNPYGLYPVSDKAYFLLLISVFCFSISFIINGIIDEVKVVKNSSVNEIELMMVTYERLSKNKFFLGGLIMFTLFIARYLIAYQKAIVLYGTEQARTMRFFVGEVFKSTEEVFFYNYVVESFSILVLVYIAFSLVWLKFNIGLFFSLIFAYVYSSFGAGRFFVIELGFYIGFLFVVKRFLEASQRLNLTIRERKKIKNQQFKVIMIITPVLLILYFFSIYLSNFRQGLFELTSENFIQGNSLFFEQIIVYCVGSFRALDYGLTHFVDDIGYTFGRLSFGGIDELFGVSFQVLGINYHYSNEIYGFKTSDMFPIGFDQYYNALFTNVFGQYLDFRYLGVIFLSLFWGIVFNKFIGFFLRTRTIYSLFIFGFLFVTAIMSPLVWKLQAPSSWIFLGTIFLIRNT